MAADEKGYPHGRWRVEDGEHGRLRPPHVGAGPSVVRGGEGVHPDRGRADHGGFYRLGENRSDRWSWAPGQLELLDGAKAKARELGLWNFFLPDAETGVGLSNLDCAYIAVELGKNRLASEWPQLLGPGHGEHGGARAGGHPRTEAAVARAAAERRDPIGVRDDRAGDHVVGCEADPDQGRARRRRVGDQRREVLHLQRATRAR
ncbi:MAG: hypothetical protein R2713_22895 [Ilumatobacteraceae bacterium]